MCVLSCLLDFWKTNVNWLDVAIMLEMNMYCCLRAEEDETEVFLGTFLALSCSRSCTKHGIPPLLLSLYLWTDVLISNDF